MAGTSLADVMRERGDPEIKEGDVRTQVWGEPGGGSDKTSTEKHRQAEIRVRVSPTPHAREAREN